MFKFTEKQNPNRNYERDYVDTVRSVEELLNSRRPKVSAPVKVVILGDDGAWVVVDGLMGYISYVLLYPHVTVERVKPFQNPEVESTVKKASDAVVELGQLFGQLIPKDDD